MTVLAVCWSPSGLLEARNGAAIASPNNAIIPKAATFARTDFLVSVLCNNIRPRFAYSTKYYDGYDPFTNSRSTLEQAHEKCPLLQREGAASHSSNASAMAGKIMLIHAPANIACERFTDSLDSAI